LTRLWARRGSRPRAPRDRRYAWAYLFGAVCPERAVGAGLVLPSANTTAMRLQLQAISRPVRPGAHAVLVLDGAGWHGLAALEEVPRNLTLLPLPPYSPELNPAERWFKALRRVFANAIFDTLEELEDALTEALRPYWQNPTKLQRLVGYPWWCRAVTGLTNTASPTPRHHYEWGAPSSGGLRPQSFETV
jgi:transposase